VEGQIKGQEALKTGLAQGAKTTDQNGGRIEAIGGQCTGSTDTKLLVGSSGELDCPRVLIKIERN
jgi:hypothetical protein